MLAVQSVQGAPRMLAVQSVQGAQNVTLKATMNTFASKRGGGQCLTGRGRLDIRRAIGQLLLWLMVPARADATARVELPAYRIRL
jgi:hypothetical protein